MDFSYRKIRYRQPQRQMPPLGSHRLKISTDNLPPDTSTETPVTPRTSLYQVVTAPDTDGYNLIGRVRENLKATDPSVFTSSAPLSDDEETQEDMSRPVQQIKRFFKEVDKKYPDFRPRIQEMMDQPLLSEDVFTDIHGKSIPVQMTFSDKLSRDNIMDELKKASDKLAVGRSHQKGAGEGLTTIEPFNEDDFMELLRGIIMRCRQPVSENDQTRIPTPEYVVYQALCHFAKIMPSKYFLNLKKLDRFNQQNYGDHALVIRSGGSKCNTGATKVSNETVTDPKKAVYRRDDEKNTAIARDVTFKISPETAKETHNIQEGSYITHELRAKKDLPANTEVCYNYGAGNMKFEK